MGLCSAGNGASEKKDFLVSGGAIHVFSGQNIQAALDLAADHAQIKTVKIHAGTYRPSEPGQALLWLNHRHDGILLEAQGAVVLTAANSEIADPQEPSFPAVVNHVVYFGDGVSSKTVFRGFTLTGSNGFRTKEGVGKIQPDPDQPMLVKAMAGIWFFGDGGAIKIFGRSYPVLENLTVSNNFANPCGGGISIEHQGFVHDVVRIRNCRFINNRCQITGSAIDVLPVSALLLENCLFVGNLSNTGADYLSEPGKEWNKIHGSGALTVFPGSRVAARHCTFTGNWNGIDDRSSGNIYEYCLFWMNTKKGGISPGERYEMHVSDGRGVKGCVLNGKIIDLRNTLDPRVNRFPGADPDFDEYFVPRAPSYEGVGYRPVDR